MCRSTDNHHSFGQVNAKLRIQSIVVGLSGLNPTRDHPLPRSLTLVFLPRVGSALEVNGSKIRPDSPAFVPLHRRGDGAEFGSDDRVAVGSGARLEVYLRDEKILRGVFRRDDATEWRLEVSDGVVSAGVRVSAEGHVAVREKAATRRRCFEGLEEIPEAENEECECDCGSDGGDSEREMDGGDKEMDVDVDTERVGWAVDVGIWAVCLGVGFLVSKASSKSLRRRRIFV